MRNDIDFLESRIDKQVENFCNWLEKNSKRSITVLEIGAGPSQPISRTVGENLLQNEKFRASLIRINPIRERKSLYEWET